MIDINKKYTYRNGEPARLLCLDGFHKNYPVVSMNTYGVMYTHTLKGREAGDGVVESPWDLIEAKEKKYQWLNIVETEKGIVFGYSRDSLNAALVEAEEDKIYRLKPIARIKV